MTIEDILAHWKKDAKIDGTSLEVESLKIPQLHHKYYKMYLFEKVRLDRILADSKELERLKFEYYSGKLDQDELTTQGWEQFDKRVLKQDIPLYLDADADLSKVRLRIALQREKISFLQSIITSVNSRNFTISNSVKALIWSQGGQT